MQNKILKLVNSPEFQELKSNAHNVENHRVSIGWWLNPKSEHGLGDAPLKLFLRLAATKSLGKATFGIDGFEGALYSRVLAGNYNIQLLEDIETEKDGIDIWAVLDLSYEEDGKIDRRIIPIVICNNEGEDLTKRYLNAVIAYQRVEHAELSPMGILLSEEPTEPSCSQFDNITYTELSAYVIEPLMSNTGYDSALQRLIDNHREIIDTAFASLYRPSVVEKIIDEALDATDEETNILRMLWDANEEVFEAAIYHLYKEQHQATLDRLFKSSKEYAAKYIVSHNGKEIFPGKQLSKAMTACAIIKAYLEEYPATTLTELQKAFPCEALSDYYYDRYYNDLFYESNPNNIDCSGEQVLPRTGGRNIGSEVLAKWDFYVEDELLLPIENGTKRAMCVKIWRKNDFGKLISHVHEKGYDKFITIKEC